MKKFINLIWITTLISPSTNAAEVVNWSKAHADDTIRVLRAKNANLREYVDDQNLRHVLEISRLAAERAKDETTKRALKREINILCLEQREAKELLDDVLVSITAPDLPIPLPAIPLAALQPPQNLRNDRQDNPIPTLSAYQQEFKQDWNNGAGRIGPKAWEALGSANVSLAQAMSRGMRVHPSKYIEIYDIKPNYFKLMIDGKKQNFPYKY